MGNNIELKNLIDAATGKIAHIYAGFCPDELEGYDTRDPECPACQILTRAALAAPQQEPRAIFQEERACRAEDCLIDLVNQIDRSSPIDDHGHKITMNMAYIKAVELIKSVKDEPLYRAPPAAPVLSDEEMAGRFPVEFKLFSEDLPALKHYSSSYGGTWTSDWCITIDSCGRASVDRLTVGEDLKEAIDRGERKYVRWIPPNANSWENIVAWAYVSDMKAAIERALLAKVEKS
ncbi:hypothetical protein GN109_05645 [Collimonas pratensis]|uniref:hypothetical protein n=1 Tax=Collimonas pratensis TaxID=279113 RepID=UPI00143D6987|nr:hypothetical protein [Collimonas pratensis]NKI68897.1 hypothetical protein [Collimonas pratensis]